MYKYGFFRDMSWMTGVSPAEWEIFLNEVWPEGDERDALTNQAANKRFIFFSLGICLLLAAPAVWAILSLV